MAVTVAYNPRLVRRQRNLLALAGLTVLLIASLLAVGAGWLTPHDPDHGRLSERLLPPVGLGGKADHLLGTDHLGRDLLARLLYGGRITIVIGLLSVLGSGIIGVITGLTAGYYSGLADAVLMRLADIQLAFPSLVLAIALVAVLGPGIQNVVVVLTVGGWVLIARIIRAEVLSTRERDFVLAARAIGAPDLRILLYTILPNAIGPLVVTSTFMFGQMIVVESSLSFLGLGVQPPTPSWGGMLNESRGYFNLVWWLPVLPGSAVMLVVLAANLVGEWLHYHFSPQLQVGG